MGTSLNLRIWGLIILGLLTLPPKLAAQQVGFGLYGHNGITLTPLIPDELDFGNVLKNQGSVAILLSDHRVVPIAIEGIAYLDVIVSITAPNGGFITLGGAPTEDANSKIPITVKMAYYNQGGQVDPEVARIDAVEVVGGTITFQIARRPGGPPGPPPVPPHGNYQPPMATAYIFIYGDITVGEVNAGTYTGEIIVDVAYATYE